MQEGRWGVQRAGVCGTQNNTSIPLETAVLETSALLPFPRESMQLAVIFSYLLRKGGEFAEITCCSFQPSLECVQIHFAPFPYLVL